MFAIGASFGCGVAGFGLVAPILSFVNADIGPDLNITWVALSYLLTSSIGLIIVGRITDIFGRRWFFIVGNAIALVGSIVCAVAPSIPALIAGETLIGIGASVQLSYAFVVGEIVPTKWRFLAQGYVFLWGIPSSGFAPVIAYAFVFQTGVGWRGIYYLLIGLNGACTAAWYFFYYPPSFAMKHGSARKMRFLKEFDYIGTLMVTLGLLLLLMGLSWGGTLHPWISAHVIATIVIGFILLVAFVLYETFVPLKEPLLPMHLFRNRGWVISVILWSLGAAVYYALAILWPSMVATLYASGHSTMWAGWMSCISNSGILFGEYVGANFKRKTNYQIIVVFFLGSVFLAAMATCTPDTPVRAAIFVFLAAAFIGWNEILNSTIATISIDDQREIGTATGAGGSARSTISTICSTVYTVILSNRIAQTIPAQVPPALVSAGLPISSIPAFLAAITAGTQSAWDAVGGLTPAIQAVGVRAYQEASSDAYTTVFLSTLAFSGIGIVLSPFLPSVDHLLTEDVTVTLERGGTKSEKAGDSSL
ncbi:fungal trichothecene efflux pump [Aulographum hederae CBS 113979]|uniref:Fungal trichothecene efflux pump n=1 Tax=Aulographum hederae CBS 113979 TaxID=1176131 RepID=A0A6G1H817_9PEZI|nr:fungal trichothecene efflux pump [Aulographum hederae CBS 113979]